MNEHDDDDHEHDEEDSFPVYTNIDEETLLLIETACNCLVTLAEAQVNEESAEGLRVIADSLAERFAIDAMELEEHTHVSDDGEETILAPKGGVFPDEPDAESNPAAER